MLPTEAAQVNGCVGQSQAEWINSERTIMWIRFSLATPQRTRSGVVMQQRSIPPPNADQLATTDTTIVDNSLKDPAAVMASRHRGDGRSRPAPEKPIHPALVAAG